LPFSCKISHFHLVGLVRDKFKLKIKAALKPTGFWNKLDCFKRMRNMKGLPMKPAALVAAALFTVIILSSCELPLGNGSGASLRILLPGSGDGSGKAITDPGQIGHDAVQRLLLYKVELQGPGGQIVSGAAGYGQSLAFNLEPGTWLITTNAFFPGHGNLQANDPLPQVTVNLAKGERVTQPVTLDLASSLANVVLIPDAETFKKIGLPPASGWYGEEKVFLFLADLVLDNWEPPAIKGASTSNRAVFQGGGHTVTIRSFQAVVAGGNYGLFKDSQWADINDLKVALDITEADNLNNPVFVGGLTATGSNVNIEDVHVSGTLHVGSASASDLYSGGIAGEITDSTIESCSSTVVIKAGNTLGKSYAGGLAGEITDSDIKQSYSDGEIYSNYDPDTTYTGDGYAGGIVGKADATTAFQIVDCYSTGEIWSNAYTGGIAGALVQLGSIGRCYSIASVHCVGDSTGYYAGGITGDPGNAGVLKSFALNALVEGVGSPAPARGRVSGGTPSSFNNNYGLSTMQLGSRASVGGPLTPDTVTGASNNKHGADTGVPAQADYEVTGMEWDFTPPAVWTMDGSYPVLSWQ
jgi:hypothetical protein